jgi:hypothetical protein
MDQHRNAQVGTRQHATIETPTPYPLVKSRLEAEVKRLDGSYHELLKENKVDELRQKLTQGQEPDGLMIHYVGVHGDWLALEGGRRPGMVYYVGNVLSTVQMTKLNFSAALYAPLRLNVYGNARGGTTFEYDKPSRIRRPTENSRKSYRRQGAWQRLS